MRLLLDEHYSPEIAHRLRALDHDVVTVDEVGLRGSGDEELLRYAASKGRALLTNNVRHFAPLAQRFATGGETHAGLVFTSDTSMPRGKGTTGRYVEALSELMSAHPAEGSLHDQTFWLDKR